MAFSDVVLVLLLLTLLALGSVYIYLNLNIDTVEFENYKAEIAADLPNASSQFYYNMRYPDKDISYGFSESCQRERKEDFITATEILEQTTLLSFYISNNPQILVTCSENLQKPTQDGHFIAGEGGPTAIINATNFAVILNGSISLYRPDTCSKPQIALHELLHAIGFDHNNNENSIMFPITRCDQILDDYITDEINRIYAKPSLPDLLIEKVNANKTGRYLNLNLIVSNYGLKKVNNSTIVIVAENYVVEKYNTRDLDIGARKTVTITNLKIPRKTSRLTISIETDEPELTKENNFVELTAIQE